MGALVVEGLMRAGGVVVREVAAQQTEMPFVDHDDVIEAFAPNRTDDALGEGILPGRSRGDEDLSSAWIRRRLQVGFSRAMRRISVRSSRSSGGRPTERRRDFQRQ
jgi:hypothetical protein